MIEKNFVTILGWMSEGLGLSGSELIAYAFIYGYTQDGQPKKISFAYLAKWIGATRQTAITTAKTLEAKGLIAKTQKRGPRGFENWYKATSKETLPPTGKETLPPGSQKALPPYPQDRDKRNTYPGIDRRDRGDKKELPHPKKLLPQTDDIIEAGIISGKNHIQVEFAEDFFEKEAPEPEEEEEAKRYRAALAYTIQETKARKKKIKDKLSYFEKALENNIKQLKASEKFKEDLKAFNKEQKALGNEV
jgi:predicted transcriptional regulator